MIGHHAPLNFSDWIFPGLSGRTCELTLNVHHDRMAVVKNAHSLHLDRTESHRFVPVVRFHVAKAWNVLHANI